MLMKTDELGIPRFSNRDLIDMIYTGHIDKCHVVLCDPSDDVEKFNQASEELGLPTLTTYIPLDVDKKTFDSVCQKDWYMPEKYKEIDVLDYLYKRCNDHIQIQRMAEELSAYLDRDLENLLRYMIYLVDFMRENNIVWGVGRGSSVASYVLYLIGVHKIDSIKYNLDWREFLK